MTVKITRGDATAQDLPRLAGQVKDGRVARRLLAIALVLEGASRKVAAESCGMGRQTLRDWIHRYNAQGPCGLSNRCGGGVRPLLSDAQPSCRVAMEACSTSYYWARALSGAGHDVRLIPPIYVKPFVKRPKNDAADAEAIGEAALRPNMSFVEPKSVDKQALSMMMRTRDQLIDHRTATVNARRGHMAEFGLIVPVGIKNIERLQELVVADDALPGLASEMAAIHFEQITELTHQIDILTEKIKTYSTSSATVRRLQTMPGIGPIGAMIIETFAPDMATFKRGRDFAAWLGLIPLQKSTGGKPRLGQITKMDQKDIRRALVIGAMSRIAGYARQKSRAEPWLQDKPDRKPKMVAAIALANKMARQIWAMITKEQAYKTQKVVAT